MKKSIVTVASYAGPYFGNFIPSLIAYDKIIKDLGYRTVYVFPDFVKDFAWVESMDSVADKLYFIPYKPYSLANVKLLKKICKTENAVAAYSRMSGWDITIRLAAPSLPLIWHMEMGLNTDSLKSKIKYFIKYKILGFGKTYHISASEDATKKINSFNLKNKCVCIPNAINLERISSRENIIKNKKVNLLTFAYFPGIKGFDIALDACEKLTESGFDFSLLASAQAPTYEYIKQRYGNNSPEWLTLLEPTDNIDEVFQMADILLNTSRSEGMSYANLEGLYFGLPVIFSDIPGNSVLKDFKSTYSFENCNPDDLAEVIENCNNSKLNFEDISENRKIITEKFGIDLWIKRLSDYLKNLLDEF